MKIGIIILVFIVIILCPIGSTLAHTVDSVGNYRLEIGWMHEPAVSGETNGIELYVSPLDEEVPFEEQEFKNGIMGLEDSLKIQLVYEGEKITLPIQEDHNVPGKYFTLVDPTLGGYYQANILGNIKDTTVSLSMHPPKVENKTYLEFPPRTQNILSEHRDIVAEHQSLQAEIAEIKESLNRIEKSQAADVSYIAMAVGIAGIVIGSVAISRLKSS